MNSQTGTLNLIATPIGNLKDITLRAIETLFSVDILLCEDTRVSNKLLDKFAEGKPFPKLIPYHDHNERKINSQVITWLQEGKKIGLITDAGTPLISDPGYKLVRECLEQNIKVESIPGPSSVITALTLSGLPPDKFCFIGYFPRKSGQRQTLFKKLSPTVFKHMTFIAFESPYRLLKTLEDMKVVYGDIGVVIARELTKLYEETRRGKITEIIDHYSKKKIKGEIVVVFELKKKD